MKIEGIVPRALYTYIPKDISPFRVALIALPILTLVGILFSQLWPFSASTPEAKPVSPPKAETIQDLFNRVINLENQTCPKIIQGSDYEALKGRRRELQSEEQHTLFYAELLSDGDVTPQMVEQVKQTFLNPPDGGWNADINRLYQSFSNRYQTVKYGSHYEAQTKLETVIVKGQKLIKQIIKDNGDCLFETILEGYTGTEKYSAQQLRQLASKSLLNSLEGPNSEGLIAQLASGMEMHIEAHSGTFTEADIRTLSLQEMKLQDPKNEAFQACNTREEFIELWKRQNQNPSNEEERDTKQLALEYCKLLAEPRVIYPGIETIMILANELKIPLVIVNGNSIDGYGPIDADTIPILIYKEPRNAHYNRLVVDKEQWQLLFKDLNRDI